MAFAINRIKSWQAGPDTPYKYTVNFSLICDQISQDNDNATFSLTGVVSVTNYPNNSRNSWAASDFAVLTLGGFDPNDYPFTAGTSYYETPLPAIPNAPQSYLDAVLIEFRGDTYATDGPNRVSLYVKGQGVVLNASSADGTTPFNINTTFTIPLNGNPSQEVLIYVESGANNSTDYSWLAHQVWASMFDFDYRPGAVYSGGWLSHNRSGGAANIYNGSSWVEMRTIDGGVGTTNPPSIYNGSKWVNMRKIGQE